MPDKIKKATVIIPDNYYVVTGPDYASKCGSMMDCIKIINGDEIIYMAPIQDIKNNPI